MSLDQDPMRSSCAEASGSVAVTVLEQVRFGAANWWQVLQHIDFYPSWTVECWQLADTDVEVRGGFALINQRVEPTDEDIYELWGGEAWYQDLASKEKPLRGKGQSWGTRRKRAKTPAAQPPRFPSRTWGEAGWAGGRHPRASGGGRRRRHRGEELSRHAAVVGRHI